MLVVVLVLENPDRFAIRLREQISWRMSLCGRGIPMHRGRARRRGRGRFQISEFGLNPDLEGRCLQRLRPTGRKMALTQEAKAGAFAYITAEAKAGAFAYTTAEAKAGAFAYNSPMTLWRSIP